MSNIGTVNEQDEYFTYLRGRGRLGYLYRTRYLYPKLSRHLAGHVLDIGCGIGDFLAYRPGTVGVDINPYTVDWCRQQGLDCQLIKTDLLPFDDCCFDGVVLDNVLEHLADPQLLLAEIKRVLKPGGCFLVGVPGQRGYECDPDHKVFYSAVDLDRVICAAGFSSNLIIYAPLKSRWLDALLSQYCLYGVFERR